MFDWFKKQQPKTEAFDCTKCKHYAIARTEDKVLPDKTVVRGEKWHYCGNGRFYMEDLTPCELFKRRPKGEIVSIVPPPTEDQRKRFKKMVRRCGRAEGWTNLGITLSKWSG